MATRKPRTPKKVKAIKHGKQSRSNIPTAEMEALMADEESRPVSVPYERNRDLDPQLLWKGKDEENEEDLNVDAVPIYVQEKIHPQVIIDDLRRQTAGRRQQETGAQPNLFGDFNGLSKEKSQVEFYRHRQKWTNRMILGDSLMVMASLARKEGLKGKVQCIYMDPPYGIKFASNCQPSTKSTAVSDKDEPCEPETIQAFRDTWKWGIHSYLSYLRDRLTVARDLLTESGSVFVQIGDENVHSVRCLMDEVFGQENFRNQIGFRTAQTKPTKYLNNVYDYILWYSKSEVKYNDLFLDRDFGDLNEVIGTQQLAASNQQTRYEFHHNGIIYAPTNGWRLTKEGLQRASRSARLQPGRNSLRFVRYASDFTYVQCDNIWNAQMSEQNKHYVVQTAEKVIQRCILMTTDPGDLILDPTCGSGTTASVAEQWGRRWITIDTSRVAMAIARARLMGNQYDYYLMQDSEAGAKKEAEISGKPLMEKQYTDDVRHGFVYNRVPHITLGDIANNAEIDIIWEKWQESLLPLQEKFNKAVGKKYKEWEIPLEAAEDWSDAVRKIHAKWCQARMERQKEIDASIAKNAKTELLVDRPYTAPNTVRVTGPFTVESLSPHRIVPTDATDDELLAAVDAEAEREGEMPPQRQSRRLRPKSEVDSEARFIDIIYENLQAAGVQNTRKNERLKFDLLEPWANSRHIQFSGHYVENGKNKKAAIAIGPEYGTVTRSLMVAAAREAADMFDMLVIMGFAFEAHADEKQVKVGRMPVMRVRLNNDLHMSDRLKTKGKDNLFVVFGEPDIEARPCGDLWEVEIKGLDIFDPTTGRCEHSGVEDIACWMIDTDYNEESFFARHVYFTGGGKDPLQEAQAVLAGGDRRGGLVESDRFREPSLCEAGHGPDSRKSHQSLRRRSHPSL